ncbi:I78 family peptidase inhibitor [Acinetobacter sp. BSP-153]|uniref:I78 family peptidase inhibitor n=1 Tax=Acinetobacter sp. BSP-153 TaxID=3344663 RepID=UPI00376FBD69
MKKTVMFGLIVAALSGCSTAQKNDAEKPNIGMANPASTYCVEQGGKLEIRKEANGEVGYCHLPNGQVIEEWELFRTSQSKCVTEQATALIGQSNLTEAQIKQKTSAKIVRLVQPGQPVTMDYREERVTVTVDPKTNKVVQASCG